MNPPKLMFHFQLFVPPELHQAAEALRGCSLDFGPHAHKRWREKFGNVPKPKQLPQDAQYLEITVVPNESGVGLDTILYRFKYDEFTDVVLSLAAATKFVISVWRVPHWFGLGAGRPKNPSKYLNRHHYDQLVKGANYAA